MQHHGGLNPETGGEGKGLPEGFPGPAHPFQRLGSLQLLKRRGPPCAEPVELWLPPVLPELPFAEPVPPPGPLALPGGRDSGLQAA